MGLYAVSREAGRTWTDGIGAFEQPGANEHAAFMNDLAADGFLLFAGPLGGSEADRIRVLLIVCATDPEAVASRLANDPWAVGERLVTMNIERWVPVVGAERLTVTQ